MTKTALVLEGGGVRGAYTAGALAWLNDNNITFDYNVGISSGAVFLCCYLVHDKHTPFNMTCYYSSSPDNVGIRALIREGYYVAYKHVFNDYLLAKEHLDITPLMSGDIDLEIGVYDLELGETVWYSGKDLDPELVLLRAACSLPVASAIVEYRGRKLLDGGITKMIPIERAIEKGCDKFMVITTKPKDYVRKPGSRMVDLMMRAMYKDYPSVAADYKVRHLNYNKQVAIINDLVEEGKCLHFLPSETVKVSRYKGDSEKTKKLYQLGYTDMEARREEIFEFLKEN